MKIEKYDPFLTLKELTVKAQSPTCRVITERQSDERNNREFTNSQVVQRILRLGPLWLVRKGIPEKQMFQLILPRPEVRWGRGKGQET